MNRMHNIREAVPLEVTIDQAKRFFHSKNAPFVLWNARNELEIRICPAELAEFYIEERTAIPEMVNALFEEIFKSHKGSATIFMKEQIINNRQILTISGDGAAKLALYIRDQLHNHFVGSSSIPQGAVKV